MSSIPRNTSVLSLMLVASLIVSACGGTAVPGPTAATTAAQATAQPTPQLEQEVVVVDTGGAFQAAMRKHFYDPFEKATGVKVVSVSANSLDQFTKLKAMADAGKVEYDIISGGPASSFQFRDLLQTIDCNRLKNVSQGLAGSCAGNLLLRTFGGGIIAYRTDKFPGGGPQTPADFFDTSKFPGPRAINNSGSPQWVLAFALMADGVAPDRLFPMDLDRAFKKLDAIKSDVKVWWKTGDQSQQIIRDGEVVMSYMWSGRAVTLKKQGVPLEVSWKQAVKDYATWGITKNAPHPNATYAFLDFFLANPQAHVAFALENNNSTNNKAAADQLPAAEKPNLGAAHWDAMVDVDGNQWVQENRAAIVERFTKWLGQ
jgi:mannopine transport system substrate-binding protein